MAHPDHPLATPLGYEAGASSACGRVRRPTRHGYEVCRYGTIAVEINGDFWPCSRRAEAATAEGGSAASAGYIIGFSLSQCPSDETAIKPVGDVSAEVDGRRRKVQRPLAEKKLGSGAGTLTMRGRFGWLGRRGDSGHTRPHSDARCNI